MNAAEQADLAGRIIAEIRCCFPKGFEGLGTWGWKNLPKVPPSLVADVLRLAEDQPQLEPYADPRELDCRAYELIRELERIRRPPEPELAIGDDGSVTYQGEPVALGEALVNELRRLAKAPGEWIGPERARHEASRRALARLRKKLPDVVERASEKASRYRLIPASIC